MNEILEHNYIHYKDVYVPTIVDRVLKTLSINEKDTDMTNNKEENITQYAVTLSKLMSTHFDNFKQNYPEIANSQKSKQLRAEMNKKDSDIICRYCHNAKESRWNYLPGASLLFKYLAS